MKICANILFFLFDFVLFLRCMYETQNKKKYIYFLFYIYFLMMDFTDVLKHDLFIICQNTVHRV